MRSHLAGPSRFGAVFMVTVFSCAVLGAVWGLVIYLLPENDHGPPRPQLVPPSITLPLPAQNPDVPLSPDPSTPTLEVKKTPAAQGEAREQSRAEVVRLPFGMDVKRAMEMDSLCSEDEEDRRFCLQRKAAQLSMPCQPILRERLVRMKGNMQQMRAACEADRRQYCPDEPSRGRAIVQCLESHAQEVSDHCFQFLPKRGQLLN